MADKPTTVAQYMKALPKDRRDTLQAIRKVINANLDAGYREGIQYGMPSWFVPHSVYPPGYHCDPKQPLPYIGLASQKNHMSFYCFCVYSSQDTKDWFVEAWKKSGHKLDMGKSCVRFKSLDAVPIDLIGKLVKRTPAKKFIAFYESAFVSSGTRKKTAKKTTSKKTTSKKKPAVKKKVTRKKTAAKKTARR